MPASGAPVIPIGIDAALVRTLLEAQFPRWAALPLAPVASAGTDHALFRLGADKVVRLPRVDWAVGQGEKEHVWLARLGPHLPLAIPTPLAMGAPGATYPWPWSVHGWLDGETPSIEDLAESVAAARALARFVSALRRVDAAGGPRSGAHNHFRGVALAERESSTRAALASLRGALDADAVEQAWEASLATPPARGAGVWIHGDLHAGNLLMRRGRLSAVLDFGLLGVGDPACDLMIGWASFSGAAREAFRVELAVDDAEWARGRGWALSVALVALAYYRETNPALARASRHAIEQVLADDRGGA